MICTGCCSNANAPIWNPETGDIDCDIPPSDAADIISDCQKQAKNGTKVVLNETECIDQCEGSGTGPADRTQNCKAPDTYEDVITSDCDGIFLCDTDK